MPTHCNQIKMLIYILYCKEKKKTYFHESFTVGERKDKKNTR